MNIITALEEAEEGSNDLDVMYFRWKHTDDETYNVAQVTQSVDAALAEVPDNFECSMSFRKGKNMCRLIRHYVNDGVNFCEYMEIYKHKSLPIAILIAVIKAKDSV